MFSSTNNPLYFIGQGDWEIPDPNDVSNEEGLIALSWELNPELYDRLYPFGIFPWFEQEGVVFWFSPEVRSITVTDQVKISRSMRPYINRKKWRFSVNTAFEQVLDKCSAVERPGQAGTWVTEKFRENFLELHKEGKGYSFEVWDGEELVGGTFGIITGEIFVGESMFHTQTNASKYAYIGMCQYLHTVGIVAVDNQLPTEHLDSLGAINIDREEFLDIMRKHAGLAAEDAVVPEAAHFLLSL